jgi:Putative auto-transporter adhesin, head GIN domain
MKKIMSFAIALFLSICVSAQERRSFDSLETRDLKGFKGISASLAANIYLRQSDTFSFRAVGRTRLLERLDTHVKDSILLIRLHKDNDFFNDIERVSIYISAPSFERFDFSGFGKIVSENTLKGSKLRVSQSGAHGVNLDLDYEELSVDMSGVGNIELRGKTQKAIIEMSGTGIIDAYDLTIQNAECGVSGLGSITCFVENDLYAAVSGLGSVKYKGEPKRFKKSVSGLGKVVSR